MNVEQNENSDDATVDWNQHKIIKTVTLFVFSLQFLGEVYCNSPFLFFTFFSVSFLVTRFRFEIFTFHSPPLKAYCLDRREEKYFLDPEVSPSTILNAYPSTLSFLTIFCLSESSRHREMAKPSMSMGGRKPEVKCPPFEMLTSGFLLGLTWGPFLKSPETLRVVFGCHNSLCISRTERTSQLFFFLFALKTC